MALFISQYFFFKLKQDLTFPVRFTTTTPELPDLICILAELFSLKQIMTLVNSWNWYNLNKLQLHSDEHSEKITTLWEDDCRTQVVKRDNFMTALENCSSHGHGYQGFSLTPLLMTSAHPLLCIKQKGNVIFTLHLCWDLKDFTSEVNSWRWICQKD